jgi:hypothetical protein
MYCIRRTITGTFLSVQGQRTKPAILAFKSIHNAQNILCFHYQLENPKQRLTIVPYTKDALIAMCENAHLDIEILDQDTSITFEPTPASMIETLNRAYQKP